MTMLAKATRAWLARPASTFAAQWLVLFMLLPSPVGLAAGAYYLISGQVRGGRVAALLILVYAAAATYFLVQGWRRGARIWHLVMGVLLSAPVNWVDSWINAPHLRWKFPLWTVLLAIGLAYNLCRFAIRSRRHRESEGSLPPRDPQVSAESAGAQ
ncbi:MAG: hypothetical protein HY830_13045 [Actinobacteria bacterium]|nr:hypothetical protein [Actinomycetota bacterium]